MENETSNVTANNEFSSNIINENILFRDKINQTGFYLLLVTIPAGVVGNLAAIFIFSRPRLNRKTNTGFFYTILCILNLVKILYQAIFKRWDHHLEYKIRIYLYCEMIFEYIILQMLSWIEVLIVFDRFIAVFSPIKGVQIMSKKWVLYSIMLCLFVFIVCINSPYFIRSSISTTLYFNNYTYVDSSVMINDRIKYSTLRIIIEVHLPYFIMVVLDILVIVRLKRSKTNIVSSNNATKQTRNNRASRFTINTILIDLIYLIVNFPYTICNLITIINLYGAALILNSSKDFTFISLLFQRLPFIYSSFIFAIFMIFNRIFRSEFFSIGLVLKFKHFILSVVCANK